MTKQVDSQITSSETERVRVFVTAADGTVHDMVYFHPGRKTAHQLARATLVDKGVLEEFLKLPKDTFDLVSWDARNRVLNMKVRRK